MNLRLLLPVLGLFSLGGCLVVSPSGKTVVAVPVKTKKDKISASDCEPSQYFDGERCRHKGKGKGARKHDD
ncbi:MAG TPA: hypothetical protein VF815_42825 [Myxococcaceae bacterium]|jgi:hypothetical protein